MKIKIRKVGNGVTWSVQFDDGYVTEGAAPSRDLALIKIGERLHYLGRAVSDVEFVR